MKILETQKANLQLIDISNSKKKSELYQIEELRKEMKQSVKAHKDQEWQRYTDDLKRKQEINDVYKSTMN
jgi:hypothetical protein